MLVDKPLILRKLAKLEECHQQIREYSEITAEDYAEDWKTQRIVERTLQIMIELCLDIAGHIISDKKLRIPDNYADTFRCIGEAGLIEPGIVEIMVKMTQFRNVIVHQYERINSGIVVSILQKHLEDFLKFKNSVVALIENDKMGARF